jgi:DNA modification methylase
MTLLTPRRYVHPFPARMAPDVALQKIAGLTTVGSVVLDPMCGSGTVPRLALFEQRQAVASDVDPLAVLITRTACKPIWSVDLRKRAMALVDEAMKEPVSLPDWIAVDKATVEFVEYWFASPQRKALARVARVLARRPIKDDPLRVALSRLIVTKDVGASLARDTSHSRPHKVRDTNDFDVFARFIDAATRLERINGAPCDAPAAKIRTVDARNLSSFVKPASVDLIITSPPYLNAIDYLRGHRMSLVWLGWTVGALRELRGTSIGSERSLIDPPAAVKDLASEAVPQIRDLPTREQRVVWRFAQDMDRLCKSLARVTRADGHLVFVVADSQVRGVPVPNSALCRVAALRHGFAFEEGVLRPLPTKHRYLPPPEAGAGTLSARMREEAVLTFRRGG